MNNSEKEKVNKVAQSFNNAADYYHQHAGIQKKVAEGLISSLLPWRAMLPDGPILEIGCGTGLLTEKLIRHFPDKEFVISDASPGLIRYCKTQLEDKGLLTENIQFQVLDANDYVPKEEEFALVISNFTPHWFKDSALILEKVSKSLLPGGLLLCSFPGNHSFEQWYENCLKLGLPYTANPLPDVEEVVVKLSMGPMQIDYYENDLYEGYEQPLDFFRHLKRMGASVNLKGTQLSYRQLKLLNEHWANHSDGNIDIKWHIVYLAAKKDGV